MQGSKVHFFTKQISWTAWECKLRIGLLTKEANTLNSLMSTHAWDIGGASSGALLNSFWASASASLWASGKIQHFSISNCVCPKCLATIVQNLESGMHFSKLESVVGKTRKVFSGKYFETIPRDLVSAATAAASDLATQYSTISPPLNAFNITGLFLQTSAFSQKMFSLFLFFSLGMSFGVKSVSHDERREILMLIQQTQASKTYTQRSGDEMTLHETRDCVIFGLRNQIWNNTEAKTFGVWWCRIQEFIVNCAGFRGEIISSFLVCTNCPKNTGNYIVEECTKYWTHVGNTRSDIHNKSLALNGWKRLKGCFWGQVYPTIKIKIQLKEERWRQN